MNLPTEQAGAEVLLEHFHRLGDAPDAVPRLRRFILELAVGGKLATRTTAWQPTTLGELGEWGSGGTPNKAFQQYYGGDIPWLVIGDLNGGLVTSAETYITKAGLENSSAKMVEPGTVLIAMYGSIGKLGIAGIRCATNQAIAHCVPDERLVARDYLVVVLKSMQAALLSKGQGIAQQNISQKILKAHPLELPPLAEQHRIVAKVDELMALCDRLEAAQQQREQERTRLTAASWQALVTEGSAKAARFALEQLPALTTRPAQVKALRQTILDLAVRGKLVEQDEKDEPAEVLLKRIAKEKERLVKEGKVKKEKARDAADSEVTTVLPQGWVLARMEDLTELITKGSSPKWQGVAYVEKDEGVLFITSENVGNYRLRKLDDLKYVERKFNDIEPRSILRHGDILVNLVGASIGRAAVYDLHDAANINQAVALIRFIRCEQQISTDFLLHYLNSTIAIDHMLASRVVTAQPNMSLTDVRDFPVPIPPLAEQGRIVAKVDALMGLCDRLEAALVEGEAVGGRLLEAVLGGDAEVKRCEEPKGEMRMAAEP